MKFLHHRLGVCSHLLKKSFPNYFSKRVLPLPRTVITPMFYITVFKNVSFIEIYFKGSRSHPF